MRTYERHQAKQKGQPPSHSVMKGILAGLAAAAVDRLIETKGLDWIDAQRAKSSATRQAESMVDQVESGGGNFGGTNQAGSAVVQDGGRRNRGGGNRANNNDNNNNGGGNRANNNGGSESFSQQVAPATNDEY